MFSLVKKLVPNRPGVVPILRGPFRGGSFPGVPRASLRKMMGVYEHELNGWLEEFLPKADAIFDIGVNDGYFTFGCLSAFRRQGRNCPIMGWEPEAPYIERLNAHLGRPQCQGHQVKLIRKFVGDESSDTCDRLRDIPQWEPAGSRRTLLKIDVEGAEVDVLRGAGDWISPQNIFLIEVHAEDLIAPCRDMLAEKGVETRMIEQSPHWLLGREMRDIDNRWMVSVA